MFISVNKMSTGSHVRKQALKDGDRVKKITHRPKLQRKERLCRWLPREKNTDSYKQREVDASDEVATRRMTVVTYRYKVSKTLRFLPLFVPLQ